MCERRAYVYRRTILGDRRLLLPAEKALADRIARVGFLPDLPGPGNKTREIKGFRSEKGYYSFSYLRATRHFPRCFENLCHQWVPCIR